MSTISNTKFKQTIWNYYKNNKREFPWRMTNNPYYVYVSEIMLQQTQTSRVVEKYNAFIKHFPNIESLAKSSNSEVLRLWSGLGYNRRALYLKQSAQILMERYNGKIPDNPEQVDELPGIGISTACAIITFSYNTPLVFIETNIRRVFIHFFFTKNINNRYHSEQSEESHNNLHKDTRSFVIAQDDNKTKMQQTIDDKEIYPLVEKTLDKDYPREWYYALMDYGAMLRKLKDNPNLRSKHYTKQSTFEGSIRKVRGAVLRILLEKGKVHKDQLAEFIPTTEDLFHKAICDLKKENTIEEINNLIQIKE